MKPTQLSLGMRLRDDATFANYYPGANAVTLGYVEIGRASCRERV